MARVCVFDVNEILLDMGALDPDGQGDARISGAFDLDFVDLLPTEGAYRASEDRGAARPYDGVVTLGSPSRATASPRGRPAQWSYGRAMWSNAAWMGSRRCPTR